MALKTDSEINKSSYGGRHFSIEEPRTKEARRVDISGLRARTAVERSRWKLRGDLNFRNFRLSKYTNNEDCGVDRSTYLGLVIFINGMMRVE